MGPIEKIVLVIDSCTTQQQLLIAETWIHKIVTDEEFLFFMRLRIYEREAQIARGYSNYQDDRNLANLH